MNHDERTIAKVLGMLVEDAGDDFLTNVDENLDLANLSSSELDAVQLSVRSFQDAGIMTSNEGFVLKIGDAEYQVMVVRKPLFRSR